MSGFSLGAVCSTPKGLRLPRHHSDHASPYELRDLLEAITPESLHQEVDTGPSVGAEAW